MVKHTQPDVYIADQTIRRVQSEAATAVPVFIGYTEKGKTQQLYEIDAFAGYIQAFVDDKREDSGERGHGYLYDALRYYFEVGGDPCFVLPVGNRKPSDPLDITKIVLDLTAEAVFNVLAEEPALTLVAMPDLALLDEKEAVSKKATVDQWTNVWKAMLSACQKNNLFCLLDSPASAAFTKEIVNSFSDPATYGEYGAAYWPRLQMNDSTAPSSEPKYIPPSTAVAAMMQRIDRDRGIWKAPANVALPQVIAPQYDHWQAQDLFNAEGRSINVIRSFAGRGVRVWGCRTLARGAYTQRRYVQTRRLLTYIESNLTEMARFATFEPNNEITWIKLKGLTQAWLRQLWFQGGLFGAGEDEAFRVFIGLDETMTHADIQTGKLIIRVCIAPRYPAEFIDITLLFYISEGKVTQSAPQAPQQNRSTSA